MQPEIGSKITLFPKRGEIKFSLLNAPASVSQEDIERGFLAFVAAIDTPKEAR